MTNDSPSLLRRLFGFEARVDRRFYIGAGVSLMALKFALDAGLVFAATGKVLTPLVFFSPIYSMREAFVGGGSWVIAAMALSALPFAWVGASMSVRRALDAGASPAFGLAFLFPFANFLAMAALSIAPSRPPVETHERPSRVGKLSRARAGLLAAAVGSGIAVAMVAFSAFVLGEYGGSLFLATPAIIGAVGGAAYNWDAPRDRSGTVVVALLGLAAAAGVLLLTAAEGVICLTMTTPLAVPMAIVGGLAGRAAARERSARTPSNLAPFLLVLGLLPGAATLEAFAPSEDELGGDERGALREVVSVRIIDAPPEAVWRHVIGFGKLPPPHELIFRSGIAYPQRARIEGEGVGAVRHCEFSTGAFVEPITRWEPPHRLSFDVVAQPAPMSEMSPYRHVHPPHLDGYFRSRRGEFRLIPLPGGRTRLEGSTWYALDLGPRAYWTLWSDALIHAIHERVLAHIAREVEHDTTDG